jgi:hypothetical protein
VSLPEFPVVERGFARCLRFTGIPRPLIRFDI